MSPSPPVLVPLVPTIKQDTSLCELSPIILQTDFY